MLLWNLVLNVLGLTIESCEEFVAFFQNGDALAIGSYRCFRYRPAILVCVPTTHYAINPTEVFSVTSFIYASIPCILCNPGMFGWPNTWWSIYILLSGYLRAHSRLTMQTLFGWVLLHHFLQLYFNTRTFLQSGYWRTYKLMLKWYVEHYEFT